MQTLPTHALETAGSLTPRLEGAPRTLPHPNRTTSPEHPVIPKGDKQNA